MKILKPCYLKVRQEGMPSNKHSQDMRVGAYIRKCKQMKIYEDFQTLTVHTVHDCIDVLSIQKCAIITCI